MNKKKKNIYKAVTSVVILELVMKIIAFFKQSVVAYYYGTSEQMDMYFVANDFMVGVSETLINAAKIAIMGIYATILVKEGKKEGNYIISKFLLLFLPIAILIMLIISIGAPFISKILAPSFTIVQNQELQKYVILLSGIILFTVILMIYESILNTNEVFMVSKIRSIIYSVCVVIACLLASKQGIIPLIIAQYTSFVIYLVIQCVASRKYYKFTFSNPLKNKYLKQILKVMIPILIGNSIIRVNYMIDKAVASSVGTGVISALSYSQILDQFIIVIIINSISSIMFAHFSNLVAENKISKINKTLDNTIASLCLILIPTTLVILFQNKNIVEFVYGRGSFSNEAVILTSIALQGYSIRYLFAGIRDIIIQALYAYKEVKKPMLNAFISSIVNIVISIIFVKKMGILAIALGTSISAIVGMILNIISFKKVNKEYKYGKIKTLISKSIIPIILSILVAYIISKINIKNTIIELIISSTAIYLIYFIGMYLLKTEELLKIIEFAKSFISSKFKNRKVMEK